MATNFIVRTLSEYLLLASNRRPGRILSKSLAGVSGYHPYLRRIKSKKGQHPTIPVRDFEMKVDLDDTTVGSDLAVYGDRESTLADRYEALLKRMDEPTILDIGTNIGYYVALAGEASDGMIHAFEPAPENIELLQQNISLNDLDERVVVNEVVVSDTSDEVELTIASSSNAHSLKRSGGDSIIVDSFTVDDYCTDHVTGPVDVIRMDIEGAETDAFRGMSRLLEEAPPTILFVEIHPKYISSADHEIILDTMQEHGYTLNMAISEGIVSTPWPGEYDVDSFDELLEIDRGYAIIAVQS